MKVIENGLQPVREIENLWIPMPDGARLAARVWLPLNAEREPVPAIVEYIPYRKRDGTAWRDGIMQPYVAGHGYAVLRIDLRGTGVDGIFNEFFHQIRGAIENFAGGNAVNNLGRENFDHGSVPQS